MRFSLSIFEINITGKGSKTVIQPFYLNPKHENQVKVFIEFMEKNLESRKTDVNFSQLNNLFESEKTLKSLQTSILRFYSFSSRSIKEMIDKKPKTTIKFVKRDDIASYLASLKVDNDSFKFLTHDEIRALIFDTVNNIAHGFVPFVLRDEIMRGIENELGLPDNSLDSILYSDIDSARILTKNKDVSPMQLIEYFNYDTIETILSFSQNIQIKLKKLPGALAKNVVYLSKKNYIFTDISKTEDGYTLLIESPLELFREKSRWGKNIAEVVMYIIRKVINEKIPFQIKAVVQPRKRKAVFTLNSESLPPLPLKKPIIDEEEIEVKPEVDSKIEDQFLKTWKNYKGWKAIPEPDAILLGKKMYIPDFLLIRGKIKVYLEIVGFYTNKYIVKKKNKMQELDRANIPIIYLVDNELKQNFLELRDIKIIYYSSNNIPSKELAKLLEKTYSDYEARFPMFVEKVEDLISLLEEEVHTVTLTQLNEKLETYTVDETIKVLQSSEIQQILQKNSIIFLKSYGLVTKKIIDEVNDFLKSCTRIPLNDLKNKFPKYKESLVTICQFLGCKIHWKSFDDIEIKTPKS